MKFIITRPTVFTGKLGKLKEQKSPDVCWEYENPDGKIVKVTAPQRTKLFERIEGKNVYLGNGCKLGLGVNIGENTRVGPNCELGPCTHLGDDVTIGEGSKIAIEPTKTNFGAYIGSGSDIGDCVKINCRVRIGNKAIIEECVILHASASVGCNAKVMRGSMLTVGVLIGDDTWIEKGCKIFRYVQIGRNCDVGSFVQIGQMAQIGDNTGIGSQSSLARNCMLESGADLHKMTFLQHQQCRSGTTWSPNGSYFAAFGYGINEVVPVSFEECRDKLNHKANHRQILLRTVERLVLEYEARMRALDALEQD